MHQGKQQVDHLPVGDQETLNGTANAENLTGGAVNSTIVGDAGNDILTGDGIAAPVEKDFIVNGSFEDNGLNGGSAYLSQIEGWQAVGATPFEVQDADHIGTASDGDAVVELDGEANSVIAQTVAGLTAGATYTLTFDYAARPGTNPSTNKVEVFWNGQKLESVHENGKKASDFEWVTHTYEVTATGDADTVSFAADGKSDGLGGVIDAVTLTGIAQVTKVAAVGGHDWIDGGAGDDSLSGNAGRDWLHGGEGADTLDGGADVDTADYRQATEAVSVSLEAGEGFAGDAAGDVIENVENVRGGFEGDKIEGDGGTNRLMGADGDDFLFGLGGNDTLLGGRGADLLDGGAGTRDTAEYDWSTEGVDVSLTTGQGKGGYAEGDTLVDIEYLHGSHFDDVLTGDAGVNRLNGSWGDDVLNGMAGNDVLVGGYGADHMNGGEGSRDAADYKHAQEGVALSLAHGGTGGEAAGDTFEGIEYVYGSAHDDEIEGDDAVNRLVGGAGDDALSGLSGNDYLLGEAGNDTLTGGVGDDVFLFQAAFGNDVITDMEAGAGRTDRIWFKNLDGVDGMADLALTDTSDGALIEAGQYGTLLLEGLSTTDLVLDDFIF